jgi:hypothetical protein
MKGGLTIDYACRWKSLTWKKFEKTFFQLQCRLYKAVYKKKQKLYKLSSTCDLYFKSSKKISCERSYLHTSCIKRGF